MNNKEKEAYPSYVTIGGYLKCYDNRTAWRNSWNKTTKEDREKCLQLPNWNNEMFKEISGIDVEKELGEQKTELTIQQIADKLGIPVENLRIKD